ncbi:MAG: TetR/AcrR family transcriptional regulator [Deltaproteobacteria bacterium]|nr:TetR/AcrR family transcriptional regulator [Deltaproteobacteria bacterium]
MTRAALTPMELEDFRRRAVEAALRVFVEDGARSLTMRGIAKVLGVSPMTPYRYFEDKDALFTAMRVEATRQFADAQQQAASSFSGVVAIIELSRAYVRFGVEQPEAYRIIFELRPVPAQRSAQLDAEHERAFSFLYRGTTEAVRAGQLQGDPLTLAHLLWSQGHGLVSLHLADKLTMGRTFEQLCTAMEQTVLG